MDKQNRARGRCRHTPGAQGDGSCAAHILMAKDGTPAVSEGDIGAFFVRSQLRTGAPAASQARPGLRSRLAALLRRARTSGRAEQDQEARVKRDGRYVCVKAEVTPLSLAGTHLELHLLTLRDSPPESGSPSLSQRPNTAPPILKAHDPGVSATYTDDSRLLLRKLSSSLPRAIRLMESRTGEVYYANERCASVFGRDAFSTGTSWLDRVHSDDAERLKTTMDRARNGETVELQYRIAWPDGTGHWVRELLILFPYGDHISTFLGGVAEDITAQKNTEDALRLTQYSLDHAAVAAAWVDAQGRHLYVNDEACRMFGYTRQQAATMHSADVLGISRHEWCSRWEVLKRDGTLVQEQAVRTGDGRDIVVAIQSSYQRFQGQDYAVSFALDITASRRAIEQLEISQGNFQALFDAVQDFILIIDTQGRVLETNRAVRERLGFTSAQLRTMTVADFHPPEQREETSRIFAGILEGSISVCTIPLLAKDGTCIPVETKVGRGYWRGGPALIGISRDITDRTEAETALRESERRYTLATNAGHVAVWDWDLTTGHLFIDSRVKEALGYSNGEIEDTFDGWAKFIHPDELPSIRARTQAHLLGQLSEYEATHRLLHRDGSIRWVFVRGHAVQEEDGRPVRVAGTVTDVTPRVLAEEQVRHRLAMEEALATASKVFVSPEIDLRRVLEILAEATLADRAYIGFLDKGAGVGEDRMLEWRAPRIPSAAEDVFALVSTPQWSQRAVTTEYITANASQLSQWLHDWTASGKGSWAAALLHVPILSPTGALLGFVGLDRVSAPRDWPEEDIRVVRVVAEMVARHLELLRVEEESRSRRRQLLQADKMASLGVLVSGVAHEINNPNLLIMSNVSVLRKIWQSMAPILDRVHQREGDLLLAGVDYPEARDRIPEMLACVQEGSERIKHIVQQLRDYSRESPDGLTDAVSINDVVRDAAVFLATMIRKSTRSFMVDCAPNVPPLQGHAQRLQQVVINLIQNACQALPCPEGSICVRTSYDGPQDSVFIDVQDTGIGIPVENITRIVDPFFTTKRDAGGTGLGLSISSAIVAEHGGRLEFTSVPARGTCVRVLLPRRGQTPIAEETP